MNTFTIFLIVAHALVIPVTFVASFFIARRKHIVRVKTSAAHHVHTPHWVASAVAALVGDILLSR